MPCGGQDAGRDVGSPPRPRVRGEIAGESPRRDELFICSPDIRFCYQLVNTPPCDCEGFCFAIYSLSNRIKGEDNGYYMGL